MLDGKTIIDGVTVQQILQEELVALRAAITANIRTTGQWASGATAASMQITITDNGGELTGRRAFYTLEAGRGAGPVPRNFHDIIYQWMQVKGVHGEPIPYVRKGPHKYTPQERGDRRRAWLIRTNIKENGTLLRQHGGRDDVYTQAIPAALEKINARLMGVLQASIQQQLQSFIKETT